MFKYIFLILLTYGLYKNIGWIAIPIVAVGALRVFCSLRGGITGGAGESFSRLAVGARRKAGYDDRREKRDCFLPARITRDPVTTLRQRTIMNQSAASTKKTISGGRKNFSETIDISQNLCYNI